MSRKPAAKKPPPDKPADDAAEDDELASTPLFSGADGDEIAYLSVTRDEPEEGYLGRLKKTATERDIARKWGGGSYSISARNVRGQNVKGGHKTIEISGDPIFNSAAAEAKWRKQNGLEPAAAAGARNTPAAEKPLSVTDLLVLSDKAAERAREQTQATFAAMTQLMTASHAQQMQMIQQQQAMQRSADEAERARAREFMQSMLKMTIESRNGQDPIGHLLQGMKLMREMGGGEDGEGANPLTLLAANIPAILREGRKMFAAGGGRLRLNPAEDEDEGDEGDEEEAGDEAEAAGETEGDEATEGEQGEEAGPKIVLTGDIAEKMAEATAALEARGIDPEAALSAALEMLSGKRGRPAPTTSKAAPAPAPAAAAPPARPRKPRPERNGQAAEPEDAPAEEAARGEAPPRAAS